MATSPGSLSSLVAEGTTPSRGDKCTEFPQPASHGALAPAITSDHLAPARGPDDTPCRSLNLFLRPGASGFTATGLPPWQKPSHAARAGAVGTCSARQMPGQGPGSPAAGQTLGTRVRAPSPARVLAPKRGSRGAQEPQPTPSCLASSRFWELESPEAEPAPKAASPRSPQTPHQTMSVYVVLSRPCPAR